MHPIQAFQQWFKKTGHRVIEVKYLPQLAMNRARRHTCMRHLYASAVAIEAIAICYGEKLDLLVLLPHWMRTMFR
jgi:hypothetical protein